jgi:hypothetical protein
LCGGKDLFGPGLPMNRICLVLQKIGTGFLPQIVASNIHNHALSQAVRIAFSVPSHDGGDVAMSRRKG